MQKTLQQNLPSGPDWAPTTLIQRYEQEVCNLLSELGGINENIKYCVVTDLTRFKEFSYNSYKPVDKKALKKISEALGVEISFDMTLAEVAEKMFNKTLTWEPRSDTL